MKHGRGRRFPKKISRRLKRVVKAKGALKIRKYIKINKLKKYQTPLIEAFSQPSRASEPAAHFGLPARYHENKLVLMVRDPWWIYAYWEVTPERESEVCKELRQSGRASGKTVLRVYDVTGAAPDKPNLFFDVEIGPANNWYLDVGLPDRQWFAELGLRGRDGKFFALVRSNSVRTPRFGVSKILDEEWMVSDELFRKIFSLSTVHGPSSLDLRALFEH